VRANANPRGWLSTAAESKLQRTVLELAATPAPDDAALDAALLTLGGSAVAGAAWEGGELLAG